MSDLLRAVKARVKKDRNAHSEYKLYQECGHDHDSEGPGIEYIEDVGLVCQEGYMQSVCFTCDTDDGECNEYTDTGTWPCDAARYLSFAEARLAWIESMLGLPLSARVDRALFEAEVSEMAKLLGVQG